MPPVSPLVLIVLIVLAWIAAGLIIAAYALWDAPLDRRNAELARATWPHRVLLLLRFAAGWPLLLPLLDREKPPGSHRR